MAASAIDSVAPDFDLPHATIPSWLDGIDGISVSGRHWLWHDPEPFVTESHGRIEKPVVAFCAHGVPNAQKSNIVLLAHALTADQYVFHRHPTTGKEGWWAHVVCPDGPIDTNRFCVICPNVLGGCMGTTGPSSINPETNQVYGLDFPVITIGDMVRMHRRLLVGLGFDHLLSVIGASMGSMITLEWLCAFPDVPKTATVIAGGARHSTQNIALDEVARQAIMADPDWCHGSYHQMEVRPTKGLAVARMGAHITYMSEAGLRERFGRNLLSDQYNFRFDIDFQIESYLRHQGSNFVDRFDANSYLYLTRAMNYFDLARHHGQRSLTGALNKVQARMLVVSFSSDWLFPPSESQEIVRAALAAGCDVSSVVIDTNRGHDAFLLDTRDFLDSISGFLRASLDSQ